MAAEIIDNFRDRIADAQQALLIEWFAPPGRGSKLEAANQNLFVVFQQSFIFQALLSLLSSLYRVPCQEALIGQFRWRQRWPITEHHIQKTELIDVPPDHS